jgi:hypothetical protein
VIAFYFIFSCIYPKARITSIVALRGEGRHFIDVSWSP